MARGLLIAVSMSSLSACASVQPSEVEAPLAQFFRAACVTTGMDQVSLAEMAHDRGWSSIPHTVSSVTDRASSYSDGSFEVLLQQTDNTAFETLPSGSTAMSPASRSCRVATRSPSGAWRQGIERIATELGYAEADLDGPPFEGETKDWARTDGTFSWQQAKDGKVEIVIWAVTDPAIRFPL